MAVAPTGAIYKALEFDGVSSRTYGVYITGEAVYNAPERDVEMVTIPGRNGTYALDNGRFENIEVSYPAGIFAETETDFRQAISEFRNFLCSRKGYVRLQDEYNPDEYRLAVYKSGLEVEPAMLKAGEFKITFDCKPQRWLTSGETAITIGEWRDTETVSGDIVEVENPDEILGVKSLSVALSPIQDLNGYDKPWVGGAGKNKAELVNSVNSYTEHGITWTVKDANTIHVQGTSTDPSYCVLATSWAKVFHAQSLAVGTYRASIDNGSVLGRLGKGAGSSFVISGINNGYTFSVTEADEYWMGLFVVSGVTIDADVHVQIESGSTTTNWTPYSNICPISGRTEVETVVSPTTSAEDGTTYTTALGRTVYDGTLDVVSGVLTVDRAMVTYDGSSDESWTGANTRFTIIPPNVYASGSGRGEVLSNEFMYSPSGTTVGTIFLLQSSGQIYVYPPVYDSLANFKTWLASNPLQVIYPLATPQTYQLSPQEVALLTGTNNVWSDSGDITLEYGQLPNLLINPTLFEASPLLEIEGYGTLNVNGTEIELADELVGDVVAVYGYSKHDLEGKIDFSNIYIAPNDLIEISGVTTRRVYVKQAGTPSISSARVLGWTGDATVSPSVQVGTYPTVFIEFSSPLSFYYGTSAGKRVNATVEFTFTDSSTVTMQLISGVIYNGDREITLFSSYYPIISGDVRYGLYSASVDAESVIVHSTATAYGHPTYIDCDLGEAYAVDDGVISSLNSYIALGSKLPILSVGESEITFDNTITDLKVTPRWWKI